MQLSHFLMSEMTPNNTEHGETHSLGVLFYEIKTSTEN